MKDVETTLERKESTLEMSLVSETGSIDSSEPLKKRKASDLADEVLARTSGTSDVPHFILKRREYNRKSAARARKRQKDLVEELRAEVESYKLRLLAEERENEVLRCQLRNFLTQGDALALTQRISVLPQLAPVVWPSNLDRLAALQALRQLVRNQGR